MSTSSELESIADRLRQGLAIKDEAREKAMPLCREVIRHSSNAIRALHRQEFEEARTSLKSARDLLDQAQQATADACELVNLSFLRDAQKEYSEGCITLALVTGQPFPDPANLGVDPAAYLNGMGDTVGELRRYLLDGTRRGDLSQAEALLSFMDDIYNVLVTMDFPDAITGGLRHTTDQVRGILEKTRSDLTILTRQQSLEIRLEKFEKNFPQR